MLITKKKILII